jgi:hypothetical protein
MKTNGTEAEPRNKPTWLQPSDSFIKMTKPCIREGTISSTNGVGRTGYPHVKDWN